MSKTLILEMLEFQISSDPILQMDTRDLDSSDLSYLYVAVEKSETLECCLPMTMEFVKLHSKPKGNDRILIEFHSMGIKVGRL